MKETEEILTENIHLLKVRTIAGFINQSDDIDEDDISGFESNFSFSTAYSIESKRIKNILEVKIQAIGKEKKIELEAGYTLEFVFKIDNFEDLSKIQDDGTVKISVHLAATLAGICYSTLRGIVLEKTQGTLLNTVILPVINPYSLLANK